MITKLLALPLLAIGAILVLAAAAIAGLIWLVFAPFVRHIPSGKEDDSDLFV